MTHNNTEFRIRHLPAYLFACIAYCLLALKFTPASGAIALFTALLLSISPDYEMKSKYTALLIALITGIIARVASAFDFIQIAWLPESIVAIIGILFVLSHIKRTQLDSFIPLSYFLLLFSFLAAGDQVAKYVSLIFFPLAGCFALSVILVRANEKVRLHKRARLHKEKSTK